MVETISGTLAFGAADASSAQRDGQDTLSRARPRRGTVTWRSPATSVLPLAREGGGESAETARRPRCPRGTADLMTPRDLADATRLPRERPSATRQQVKDGDVGRSPRALRTSNRMTSCTTQAKGRHNDHKYIPHAPAGRDEEKATMRARRTIVLADTNHKSPSCGEAAHGRTAIVRCDRFAGGRVNRRT